MLSDGYDDGITQDITSSLESLETVILYDRIKKSNNEQKIRMIKRLNNVYTKSISNKQIVNSIENWNNRQIEEMGIVDHYAISTEGLKDIFDKIIEIISKIIRTIADGIRKLFGMKTKKEIVKKLKEDLNEMHESQRAEFVHNVQQKLSVFQDWFPNVDKPVFPDLSSYDVSQLKTVMNDINKITPMFAKISNGFGAPRYDHERLTDMKNMTELLKAFEEKFCNNSDIHPGKSRGAYDGDPNKAMRYIIIRLNLKPKSYTPNSKDPASTFSILMDFIENKEKFINDVNSAFLNKLKDSLKFIEHCVKKMRSYKDTYYKDDDFEKALTILLATYTRFAGNIHRVFVFPLMSVCREITLTTGLITNDKSFHDDTTRNVGEIYESKIKKYEKKLF